MNELSPISERPTPATSSVFLNRLCLVLACALLAGWASTRVKPVFWYGVLFGFLMGAAAVAISVWCPRRDRARLIWETVLLAACGMAATFYISVERTYLAALKAGTPGAAEALIAAMQDLPADEKSLPSTTTKVDETLVARKDATLSQRHERWARMRYGANFPGGVGLAEAVELLLGMVTAGVTCFSGLVWLSLRGRQGNATA